MDLNQNIILDLLTQYLKACGFLTVYQVFPDKCQCLETDLQPAALIEVESVTYQMKQCQPSSETRMRVKLHLHGVGAFDAFRTGPTSITSLNSMAARALHQLVNTPQVLEIEEIFAKTNDECDCPTKLYSEMGASVLFREDFSAPKCAPQRLERIVFDMGDRTFTFCDPVVVDPPSEETNLITSSGDLIVDNNDQPVII